MSESADEVPRFPGALLFVPENFPSRTLRQELRMEQNDQHEPEIKSVVCLEIEELTPSENEAGFELLE